MTRLCLCNMGREGRFPSDDWKAARHVCFCLSYQMNVSLTPQAQHLAWQVYCALMWRHTQVWTKKPSHWKALRTMFASTSRVTWQQLMLTEWAERASWCAEQRWASERWETSCDQLRCFDNAFLSRKSISTVVYNMKLIRIWDELFKGTILDFTMSVNNSSHILHIWEYLSFHGGLHAYL